MKSRSMNEWLEAYARTHQNPFNRKIHLVCVPAILFSILGMIWSLPVPAAWPEWLNWVYPVGALVLLFYLRLGVKAFAIMLLTLVGMGALVAWLDAQNLAVFWISHGIFVVAWIGQFYGHHVEGQKPSFFEDIKFLLIGPLWVYFH